MEKIKQFFKKYNPINHLKIYPMPYFGLFGVLSFAYAQLPLDNSFWIFTDIMIKNIISTISIAILSSVVFNVIIKSEQFLEIFKVEIRNIIYSKENLENRSDLENIWNNTTQVLCNQKFKDISKELHNKIKEHYLPYKYEFYYKDSELDINIEWGVENDYLKVTETLKTKLISHHENEIKYIFSNNMPILHKDDTKTYYKLSNFQINNKNIDTTQLLKTINKKDKNGRYIINNSFELPLSGKNIYEITRTEEKHYNLNANNLREHSATWLYQNLKVSVTYPNDLKILHRNVGIVKDEWQIDFKKFNDYQKLTASIKGLIFEKQGFLLFLRK